MNDISTIVEDLTALYEDQLFEDVLPFWVNHSIDESFGGYFTSLDRYGVVFDTDKFIWLQCRQVWTFARMYNAVQEKKEWLDIALHGASFLEKHGRDNDGNWYFSLSREGKPLIQPYNIFSDCFAAMAFAQLYNSTGEKRYSRIAQDTFNNILARQQNPKGRYSKAFPDTRPLKSFALPMILCNLVLELEEVLEPAMVESTIDNGLREVMEVFYQPNLGGGIILEHVTPDGGFSDTYDGRLFNPGHVLEAMWFVMDLALRRNNQDLINKALEISLNTLSIGWDEKYKGLFYFLDVQGHPTQQLEWDQKLWWVHLEALVATLKGFSLTGDVRMWEWFMKINNYTQNHFPDKENGEWFGYLNRQGEVLLPLKGGKWKGCFHVPRGLCQILSMLKNRKHNWRIRNNFIS